MNEFSNYLVVFQSIFVSFVAAEFLVGGRRLIRNRKSYDFCWLQLGWSVFLFLLLIETWWGSWLRRDSISSNFGCFVLTLASPSIFYFVTAFLFPDGERGVERVNLGDHFDSVRVEFHLWLFTLICTYIINATVLTDQKLLGAENGLRALVAIPLLLPVFSTKKWHQWAVFLWTVAVVMYFTLYFRWTMVAPSTTT